MKINPATLSALLGENLENVMAAITPGGIEAQERRGQVAFVANETLPVKCNCCTREQLEAIGIVFGELADDLFVNVQLPDGWQKVATDHSMHSKLLDEKGRERASIFYKAAFYDRSAHISICRRYNFAVEPVSGWDDPDYRFGGWQCVVRDGGDTVWVSDQIEPEPEYSHNDDESKRGAWLSWREQKDELADSGRFWLDEHYPDWQDPTAYW